jgi:hypothetical protein
MRPGKSMLADITSAGKKLPNRICLHALQKWGKTSFATWAPDPVFIMTRGEDGLLTLMESGQVKPTPHFPDCMNSWQQLLQAISELSQEGHPYKTLVLDTLNGAERLCHEYVCEKECRGEWDNFEAYQRGPKIALKELIRLTQALAKVRIRGVGIICLCHSQVKTFKNPEGPDYDRWEPVLAKESWGFMDRWFDMILFGNFNTIAEEKKGLTKAKAKGGQERVICTERHAAFDAGNRHGLPQEIECGVSAQEAWNNFIKALKGESK